MPSATYNGQAMTLLGGIGDGFTNDEAFMYVFSLIAPPTGSHNVDITWPEPVGWIASALSFNSVNQSSALRALNTNQGNDDSPIVQVASALDELIVDGVFAFSRTFAPGAGQTQRWLEEGAAANAAGSTEPGNSLVDMSWSMNSSQFWGMAAVAIKPKLDLLNIPSVFHHFLRNLHQ